MKLKQYNIKLGSRPRGFHLVTEEIISQVDDLSSFSTGLMTVFIKHTSASLTINENADPSVRKDFETYFNQAVPDGANYFTHTMEGPDDMPAHIKASTMGSSVTIPIANGKLNVGTWQGIYLCEHRNHGGQRNLVVTIIGD